VLELGFERLESHLDQCQELAGGTPQCVADGELGVLLMATSRNMGTHYFRADGRIYQIILVPWLPGTDYTEAVAA